MIASEKVFLLGGLSLCTMVIGCSGRGQLLTIMIMTKSHEKVQKLQKHLGGVLRLHEELRSFEEFKVKGRKCKKK